MNVKELIDQLRKFPPDASVRLGVTWPDWVTEAHENVFVGDYGGGPQINAAMDLRGLQVYVGCSVQRAAKDMPPRTVTLGHYDNPEDAARVRDFYIYHHGLDEPLQFPNFDYDKWIPPRTSSGEYNKHIAEIVSKKLLSD